MNEGSAVIDRGCVPADHPMLPGHFPGHPIVPGAWLLAWIVAHAGRRLVLDGGTRIVAGVKRAKFLRPLLPDQAFECVFKPGATSAGDGADTMRFTITSAGARIAEGTLQLASTGDR